MVDFFINIVVFIIALALVVMIHEFGHFITAKMFKVYVQEFSIGFGPAIFTHKKEGKETKFSIRAIPLGGYCSLVDGNTIELSDDDISSLSDNQQELINLNKTLPRERTLNGVAKWKKAIIMVAGVTLNFILGFVLLIATYAMVEVPTMVSNVVAVEDGSLASQANWTSDDVIVSGSYVVTINNQLQDAVSFNSQEDTTALYNAIVTSKESGPILESDNIYYSFLTSEDKEISFSIPTKISNDTLTWENLGVSFSYNYDQGTYHYSFKEVMKNSAISWGNYSIAIFKALGTLFTKEGISQVGSVVQIFVVQEQVLSQGIAYVLNLWALISINLGIMNLLPFPGLDGWHLLVVIIEGITRKPLPEKFKNVMSNIGMVLLLALGLVLIVKDLWALF